MKDFDEVKKGAKIVPRGVNVRSTSKLFQQQYQYVEDAYERKEDMRKLDYQRRAALILDKNQAYTSSVKQHGTFDPTRKTYGSELKFSSKYLPQAQSPNYGAFKIGNLPKQGYNKLLGPNPPYVEDPIEDTVTYQKDIRNPIWRSPASVQSMPFNPMSSTYKNTGGRLMRK